MDIGAHTLRSSHEATERVKRRVAAFHIALPFSERRALLLIGDALFVNVAVLAALRLWAHSASQTLTLDFALARWFWFPVLASVWCFMLWLSDLYDVPVANHRNIVARRISTLVLVLLIAYVALYFVLPRDALPRLFFLFFSALSTGGLIAWRGAYAAAFTLPPLRRSILVVGAGWAGRTLAQALSKYDPAGYRVVGFVDDDLAKQDSPVADLPVLGSSDDLVNLVRTLRVDEVAIAITHEVRGGLFQALMDCQAMGIRLVPMASLYEQLTRRVPIEHVNEGWVLDALGGFSALSRLERAARRLLDLIYALIGLILMGVLLPLVALAIYLDDKGAVFYSQVRSGLGGKPFRVVKFRTMRIDAEEDGQARWAGKNDDRVTRVGRSLRRFRLDELPQVINVLRGEMSMVGPRPERPEFIAELEQQIPFYRARLVIKPGLTGWAQIHYRYGNCVEDALIKLQYDLYYIRHRSIGLDLYILLKTIGVALRGTGV